MNDREAINALANLFTQPRVLFDVNYHVSVCSKPEGMYDIDRSSMNIMVFVNTLLKEGGK